MSHISVLPIEVMEDLDIQPDDTVFDGTLGGAGHSLMIADTLTRGQGALICADVDLNAITGAQKKLASVINSGLSVTFYHGSFANFADSEVGNSVVIHKILLDLGWSSNQFEDASRGFSFMHDGPLDMRLSFPGSGETARDILHKCTEAEIVEILEIFGEEKHSKKIAAAIVHERIHGVLETTQDLVRVVESVIPRRGKTHPATQTFQALRIAVNHELDAIIHGIHSLWTRLASQGRFSVITFHSLEDRIVKKLFAEYVELEQARLLHKHVVVPRRQEFLNNPRSRSAKLRTIIKI